MMYIMEQACDFSLFFQLFGVLFLYNYIFVIYDGHTFKFWEINMMVRSFFLNSAVLCCVCATSISLSGCAQKASWHADDVAKTEKNGLTIGEAKRNVKKGMSGGEVAEALGSPNIVSTDENGNEVWIYDRFYTEQVASVSNGLTFSLSDVAGGAARSSQSSTTVIIKFDSKNRVRDLAYHKSSF
ncbi:MAG: hypothetical protein IAE63_04045 [Alphaproteobacteria bacterium]|nr:hypothetical protein [Alphaproteobacteria bacterium]MCB9985190.1 hypothetical protein [Micavibrio sp.]